jgi:hypothetical protein
MRLSLHDLEFGNWQFDIGFAYKLLERYDDEAYVELSKLQHAAPAVVGSKRLKELAPFDRPAVREMAERILFPGLGNAGIPD